MKNIKISKFLASLAVCALLAPLVSLANSGGQPSLALLGAKDLSPTQATVSVAFDSATAEYAGLWESKPVVSVQYADANTGSQMVTPSYEQVYGSRTISFTLDNLVPGTTYQYRAIMLYNGQSTQTSLQRFTTPKTSASSGSGSGSASTTSSGGSSGSAGSSTLISTKTTSAAAKTAGVTKVADNLQSIVMTGGYGSKNGVAMSITDSHARVVGGDVLTYTIQYHNSNQRTLKTARIVVDLPDQYAFDQGDANTVSDTGSNIVTIYLGSIEPGESGQVTFTARAIGPDNLGVVTRANLVYLGGSVSAADRDTYVGGSKTVLGASVFGAGFFPQTFFGWVLVILIIVIIVIAARRYMSKPKH